MKLSNLFTSKKRITATVLSLLILATSITTIAALIFRVDVVPHTFKVVKNLVTGGNDESEISDNVTIENEDGKITFEDGKLILNMPEVIEYSDFTPPDLAMYKNYAIYDYDAEFKIINDNDYDIKVNLANVNMSISETDLPVTTKFQYGSDTTEREANKTPTAKTITITVPAKSSSPTLKYSVGLKFIYNYNWDTLENKNNTATVSAIIDIVEA